MGQAYVTSSVENGVSTIDFFHPAHNSMPSHLLKHLQQQLIEAGENQDVKVVVLKSGGNRTFCAGASFEELKSITNETEGKAFFMGFANVINAMRNCPKPIIGRVQGKAVGGGVGLISACDYALAIKHASIKLSELSIGIGPFVIAPAIERKAGVATLLELTLNCTHFFPAEWCKQKSLFADVFEDAEALDKAVTNLATTLATYNPEALITMKKVFWEGTEHWDNLLQERAEMSGKLVLSEFAQAFLKKY